MELLILVFVLGVALGVGFTAWKLSEQEPRKHTWVVDQAGDLTALEKNLNHLSEEGLSVHQIFLFRSREPEFSFDGVIVACRSDPQTRENETQAADGGQHHNERLRSLSHFLIDRARYRVSPEDSSSPTQPTREVE